MDNTYERPRVTDLGSLEQMTASCGAPGAGDAKFPGNTDFNIIDVDSTGIICISK